MKSANEMPAADAQSVRLADERRPFPVVRSPAVLEYEAFQEMLRYVRFGDDDAEALRALLPHIEPTVSEISDEFYERIREHPDASRVFRDEAQVRRLQSTLQTWILEMLRGPHDEAYFRRREQVGSVHAKVGVAQRYVFGAMSLVRLQLQTRAAKAFASDPTMDLRVRIALSKILDIELTTMMETYRRALLERVRHVEELEREGIVRQLAAAEERYRDAIESAQALVVVLDENERVLLWNRMASEITGYESDEVLGERPLADLLPDDHARRRILSVRPGHPVTFEAPLLTRSGRERHVRWFVSATNDPERGALAIYVFGVDITDVREAERRAHNSARLAAVGTMAAGLAHEIRNPLNAASLHVSLLERSLRQLPDAPPVAMEAAEVLRQEISRLSALVTEFLDFARPRPLNQVETDLVPLVRTVVGLLAPQTAGTSIELVLEPTTRRVIAPVDAERVRQVLLNLLQNALDAVRERGKGRVTVRVRRIGSTAEIDVEDDGPGIAGGAPVFDAFFTTKEHGTGLGLAIVHRIVDDHGGTVDFRSTGASTVFTVRFPRAISID